MIGGVGPFEPSIPQLPGPPPSPDPAYAIAVFGDVSGYADWPRTKRVTGVVVDGIHQIRNATATELLAVDTAARDSDTDAKLRVVFDEMLYVISKELPTAIAEIQAGKYNARAFTERVRRKTIGLRRPGSNSPQFLARFETLLVAYAKTVAVNVAASEPSKQLAVRVQSDPTLFAEKIAASFVSDAAIKNNTATGAGATLDTDRSDAQLTSAITTAWDSGVWFGIV